VSLRAVLITALLCAGCPDEQSPTPVDAAPAPDATVADVPAVDTTPAPDTPPPEPVDGEALYQAYCALCHGAAGEGYKADGANALANQAFLATASDALLEHATLRGRPGTPMSAWGQTYGGPLSDEGVAAVVAFMRAWQTEPTLDLSDVTVDGIAERAEPHYEIRCAPCHGEKGTGAEYMSIADPEFLADVSDGYLRHAIAGGRADTPMPAYESVVTEQTLDDLVVLIRSWQTEPGEVVEVTPPAELGPVVINPDGPEPTLPGETRYVSVDAVAAALEAGSKLVVMDARPTGDYALEHIAGAVSVPFYSVADYVDQLPQDVWIVTYCACPHAESDAAADALETNGFTQVRVLDEGFLVWKEKGLPVESGLP